MIRSFVIFFYDFRKLICKPKLAKSNIAKKETIPKAIFLVSDICDYLISMYKFKFLKMILYYEYNVFIYFKVGSKN